MTPVCVNPRARQNGSRPAVSEVERVREEKPRVRAAGRAAASRAVPTPGQHSYQLLEGPPNKEEERTRRTRRKGYLSCASPA